jgi:E3 ubiquitin-protein ligase TRIP12
LLQNVPVASFIGSILSSRDHPALVTGALQLVELLLIKSPTVYKASLRKEGVLHEVSQIAAMELKVIPEPSPPPAEPSSSNNENGDAEPAAKVKTSSVPSDPQDAYVIRSRLIKIKYLTSTTESAGSAGFDTLKAQITTLGKGNATEDEMKKTLQEIAEQFSNLETGVSSFELLKSGLVDGLLAFATSEESGGIGMPFSFASHGHYGLCQL